MTFQMISWTGEAIDNQRLGSVNVKAKLARKRTPHEIRFSKFMSGFCDHKSALWYTSQKVFHVHAQQAFIVDFYFQAFKLAVEIDGACHARRALDDEWRTKVLGAREITVLRVTNDRIEDDVYGAIRETIQWMLDSRFSNSAGNVRKQLRRVRQDKPALYARVFPDASPA